VAEKYQRPGEPVQKSTFTSETAGAKHPYHHHGEDGSRP